MKKPTLFLLSFLALLFLPVCAVEAGSPKIQLDVDRNIYPSQDPAFEYQANAKMLSVYFNQSREEDKAWTLGIWVCANPEPKHWWHHHKTNTYAFFDLPQTDDYTVKDNMITYHYDDIDIQFEIGLDRVQRTIIVKSPQAIEHLASYLKYNALFNNLSPKAIDSRQLGLDDGKDTGLYVQSMKIKDSSRTRIFHPKKKQRYAYITAHSQKEALQLNNDILELKVDWDWLRDKDRVFPIYINDEITGWQSVSSITLAGKFDGGNAASTLYDGNKTQDNGVGGRCDAGDTGTVATSYDTDIIDLDLGSIYNVNQIKVWWNGWQKDYCKSGAAAYVKVQYWTGSAWADFGGTDEIVLVNLEHDIIYLADFNAITEQSTTKVRINTKEATGGPAAYREFIDEIEIYGTAAAAERKTRVNTPHSGKFTNGLVGYWSFDGANMDWSQTTAEARDQSGEGNHGDVIGPTVAIGKVGQALEFDGSDDYVLVNQNSSINDLGPMTINVWAKFNTGYGEAATNFIVGKKDAPASQAGSWYYGIGNTGRLHFGKGYSTSDIETYTSAGDIPTDTWVHLVLVWDGGNDASEDVVFYKNGNVLSHAYNNDGEGDIESDASHDIYVGTNSVINRSVDGIIDEVRIYNRALGEDEIEEMYQAGAREFQVNTPITDSLTSGLVGHWTFNGEDMDWSQTTAEARDQSGQNNHGDVKNGAHAVIGQVGQALEFDGVDDYVEMGTQPSLTGEDAATLSFWFNAHVLTGQDYRHLVQGYYNNFQTAWVDGSNLLRAVVKLTGGNIAAEKSFTATGSWHHFVWVLKNSQLQIYIDTEAGTGASGSGSITTGGALRLFQIGAQGGEYLWDGLIDEVRIYNRALSEDEIEALYNLGARRFLIE